MLLWPKIWSCVHESIHGVENIIYRARLNQAMYYGMAAAGFGRPIGRIVLDFRCRVSCDAWILLTLQTKWRALPVATDEKPLADVDVIPIFFQLEKAWPVPP